MTRLKENPNLNENIYYPQREKIMQKEYEDEYKEPVIQVCIQPEEQHLEIPRKKAKNVERLLIHLGIRPYTALVARDGIPITPDTPLFPNQNILVRKVMSSG